MMNKTVWRLAVRRAAVLCLAIVLGVLGGCGEQETTPPKNVYRQIVSMTGTLPAGLVFETTARESAETYLPAETAVALFGDENRLRKSVQSGYLYLSASMDVYEEIFILLCYSTSDAVQMGGILTARANHLSRLEKESGATALPLYTACHGRYLVCLRLDPARHPAEILKKLDF